MAKKKKRSGASSQPSGQAASSQHSPDTTPSDTPSNASSARAPASGGPPRPTTDTAGSGSLVGLHMRFGWWSLLGFMVLGTVLEAMHGFKVGWYLDVGNETRRLMWTLAHAHGVLLSLVHIAFAAAVTVAPTWSGGAPRLASSALMTASLLMPLGFLLGGVFIYGGDPGLGVFLVPVGALALFLAVFLTARAPFRA